jgi:hypothetical protein
MQAATLHNKKEKGLKKKKATMICMRTRLPTWARNKQARSTFAELYFFILCRGESKSRFTRISEKSGVECVIEEGRKDSDKGDAVLSIVTT